MRRNYRDASSDDDDNWSSPHYPPSYGYLRRQHDDEDGEEDDDRWSSPHHPPSYLYRRNTDVSDQEEDNGSNRSNDTESEESEESSDGSIIVIDEEEDDGEKELPEYHHHGDDASSNNEENYNHQEVYENGQQQMHFDQQQETAEEEEALVHQFLEDLNQQHFQDEDDELLLLDDDEAAPANAPPQQQAPNAHPEQQQQQQQNIHEDEEGINACFLSRNYILYIPRNMFLLFLFCIALNFTLKSDLSQKIMPIESFRNETTLRTEKWENTDDIKQCIAQLHRERISQALLLDDLDVLQRLNVSLLHEEEYKKDYDIEGKEMNTDDDDGVAEPTENDAAEDASLKEDYEENEGVAEETVENDATAETPSSPQKNDTETQDVASKKSSVKYWKDVALVLIYMDRDYLSQKWVELLQNLQQYLLEHEMNHTPLNTTHAEDKHFFLSSKLIFGYEETTDEGNLLTETVIPKTLPSITLYLPEKNGDFLLAEYIQERNVRKLVQWMESRHVYIPPMSEEDFDRIDV